MNTILGKTRLQTLNSSTLKLRYAFRQRVLNPIIKSSAKGKETLIFLQNGFSKVSLGCATAIRAPVISSIQKRNYPAEPGSGAGKGGGAGGAVKEAGGGLGKYGAANEEQFFHNKSKDEIDQLKKKGQEKSETPGKKEE